MAGTIEKGLIGKEDLALWDGGDRTFTRTTSSGYDLTLTKIAVGEGMLFVSLWDCDLAAAVAAIGSDEVSLVIDCDVAVSTDTVCPATLNLRFLRGSVITVATTKTLTIGNMTDPGAFQIFSLGGSGKVAFSQNSVDCLRPEWWGAKGDATGAKAVGTDDTDAVSACLTAAISSTIPMYVPATALYRITSEIDKTSEITSRLLITGERLRSNTNSTEDYKVRGGFFKDFLSTSNESMLVVGGTATGTRAHGMNISGVNFTGSEDWTDDNGQLLTMKYCSEASICDTNFSEYKGCGLLVQNTWDLTLRDVRGVRTGDETNSRFCFEIVDILDLVGNAWSNHVHLINVRSENSPHGELKIVGMSTARQINDIYFTQCKFHGPTSHTGPQIYMENVEKIFWATSASVNSKNKGIHIKAGDSVWFSQIKIQGCQDEQIYVEGDSHVYVESGIILGPNDPDSHVSATVSSDGTSTFTDTNATFVTDEVDNTMIVKVSGFTDDANNGYFSIASVTEQTVVIDQTSLAVEAVGDTVTMAFYRPFFAVVDADSHLYVGPHVDCYQFGQNVFGGMRIPVYGDGVFTHMHLADWGLQVVNERITVSRESHAGGYFAGRNLDADSGAVDGNDRVRIRASRIQFGDGSTEPDTNFGRNSAGVIGPVAGTDLRVPGFAAVDPSYLVINSEATDYYLWVDNAGKLRILNAEPSAHNDGTVVGAQTA